MGCGLGVAFALGGHLVYAMPTPVWILHPPTRPMMLACTRFHGSHPRFSDFGCVRASGMSESGRGV